jgi:hypothetical protein
MIETREELDRVGDTLIDHHAVDRSRNKLMLDAYESYKQSTILLGYFSQLRDFNIEHGKLLHRVLSHRQEILAYYKPLLIDSHTDILKQMLISPMHTEWYAQGIHKYKKVKNYSTFYYRRKILITMERTAIDLSTLKILIDTVVSLDKYYDIYDETVGFFMQTSDRFDHFMRQYFPDCIHL